MQSRTLDKSKFLNVDLRNYSKSDLQPLVSAMGGKVIELYVGRERRMYKAQLELATGHPKSPESIIRGLCKLIQELPSDARRLWDAAKSREFDIGIEAPELIGYYWCSLGPTVIKASSDIKAFVTITIYGPMKTVGKPGKSASSVEKTPA